MRDDRYDRRRKARGEHDGSEHYFCSSRCHDKFRADPELYLPGAHLDAVEEVPEGTIYTCPMHPEIRQAGPGSCPICGMALEPETVSLDDGPDPELVDMRRRFWWSALLTLPLFVYAMSDMIPWLSFDRLIEPVWAQWAQLVLATPVVLWGGWPFFVRVGVAEIAQSQHVHADRYRRWNRLSVQSGGDRDP